MLSVSKGVYKYVNVESGQAVAGSETTGGTANLKLNTSLGAFVLSAAAHAQSKVSVGGLQIYPWWWSAYVAAETARQKASKEARAVQIDDVFVLGPLPFASGELQVEAARSGELVAVMRPPRVEATAFVPRVLTLIEYDEVSEDEVLSLVSAAILLAA